MQKVSRKSKGIMFISCVMALLILTTITNLKRIHSSQSDKVTPPPLIIPQLSQKYGFETDGLAICNQVNGSQIWPDIISDGAGGAYITWTDERTGWENADLYVQRINGSGDAYWINNGTPVCTSRWWQYYPQMISDGAGGAIITWEDNRNGPSALDSESDIYVQRINSTGGMLWKNNGTAICTENRYQQRPHLVSDGEEGAIIAWMDYRTNAYDIYVQRINSTGDIQWAVNGTSICLYSGYQYIEDIISDGAGGAIVLWRDTRNDFNERDLYAQKINSSGFVQWDTDGVRIANISVDQSEPKICSDGMGGAIITWMDNRTQNYRIYAQRINSTGKIQWTANGTEISKVSGNQKYPGISSDGIGGAIILWADNRNELNYYDIYAQRINSTGHAQWNNADNAICIADNNQWDMTVISDGKGGAICGWRDDRDTLDQYDIYAQRINIDGIINSTLEGIPVCKYDSSQWGLQLCRDGGEGAIFTWADLRNTGYSNDIYAQRLLNFSHEQPKGISFGNYYLIIVFLGVISLIIPIRKKFRSNLNS